MQKDMYIIGGGTYGEAIYDLAEHCGYNIKGFYDDDPEKWGEIIFDSEVIGSIDDLFRKELHEVNVAVALGNNSLRNRLLKKVKSRGGNTPSLIHKTVTITKNCNVGEGVYIQPNVTIWTSVTIGNNCILSPGVIIAHHSQLKEGAFVSQMADVGAGITICEEVFVGMNAIIVTGLKEVGRNSVVGAGAVVLEDVPSQTVVAGIPAKKIRNN